MSDYYSLWFVSECNFNLFSLWIGHLSRSFVSHYNLSFSLVLFLQFHCFSTDNVFLSNLFIVVFHLYSFFHVLLWCKLFTVLTDMAICVLFTLTGFMMGGCVHLWFVEYFPICLIGATLSCSSVILFIFNSRSEALTDCRRSEPTDAKRDCWDTNSDGKTRTVSMHPLDRSIEFHIDILSENSNREVNVKVVCHEGFYSFLLHNRKTKENHNSKESFV